MSARAFLAASWSILVDLYGRDAVEAHLNPPPPERIDRRSAVLMLDGEMG